MQKKKTQQFAKFFLKDLKSINKKEGNDKSNLGGLNLSSVN